MKKYTRRHLDFWPLFWNLLQTFSFSKKYEYFFIKIILQMEKSLFVDFCQIFENKMAKIRHLGLCRHFERFSKTLYYKMLVLLNTKRGKDF
jgi:hypothetical protein